MSRFLALASILIGGALLALVIAIPGDQLVPAFVGGGLIGIGIARVVLHD